MRHLIVLIAFSLAGCSAQKVDTKYWTSSVNRYINGGFATKLTSLLGRIERGDLSAWREFASYAGQLDAEKGETYDVACGELLRRDPTFYLRRFLAGDLSSIPCARKGYGASGYQGRSLLDAVYAQRLYIASASERRQIQSFIDLTTQWKTL